MATGEVTLLQEVRHRHSHSRHHSRAHTIRYIGRYCRSRRAFLGFVFALVCVVASASDRAPGANCHQQESLPIPFTVYTV